MGFRIEAGRQDRAFSSEVGTREENATRQRAGAFRRFGEMRKCSGVRDRQLRQSDQTAGRSRQGTSIAGTALATLFLIAAFTVPGRADGAAANGEWVRDNGEAKMKVAACSQFSCGTIIWVDSDDRKEDIGKRVFHGMKQTGPNSWEGKAFNPRDGKTYTGKWALSGSTLTTSGCTMNGMLCRDMVWSRSR